MRRHSWAFCAAGRGGQLEPGALTLRPATSIRKLVRTTSAIVRLRKLSKPLGLDRPAAIEKCPADAVHSVHDPVIGSQDDRIRRIHLTNEPEVLYDLPNSGPLPLIEPVLGVDLREVIKRDSSTGR